jgi:hypothetical protein
MKHKATLPTPRFEYDKYVEVLTEYLSDVIALAAFEWINAATAEIPVWSGASHATFLKLANSIDFQLSINRSSTAPNRTGYGQAHSEGGMNIDGKGRFTFLYETNLKHLVYNEYNNANITPDDGLLYQLLNPGPYDFQRTAREAFLRSVRSVSLPDPFRHIKVSIRRVK